MQSLRVGGEMCLAGQLFRRLICHALAEPGPARPLFVAVILAHQRRAAVAALGRAQALAPCSSGAERAAVAVAAVAGPADQEHEAAAPAAALTEIDLHPAERPRTRQRMPAATSSRPREGGSIRWGDPGLAGSPSLFRSAAASTQPAPLATFRTMTLVVDITHWLDERGELPTADLRLRRLALRIARFIEYGGPLDPLQARETLIECKRRPAHKPCLGLLWVMKRADDRIEVFCRACRDIEAVISDWQDTVWAEGIMPAVPMTDD